MSRLLSLLPPDLAQALAGYPPWLVAAAALVAAIVVLWVVAKLVKLALYVALIALIAALLLYGGWLALSALHLL